MGMARCDIWQDTKLDQEDHEHNLGSRCPRALEAAPRIVGRLLGLLEALAIGSPIS